MIRAALILSMFAACGSPKTGALNVCAAASLRAAFEAIDKDFAAARPGVEVKLNSTGSQTLKAQIEAGAPCDVLATADEATMGALVKSGHVLAPKRFASSSLVILVPPANPGKVTVWSDLPTVSRIALASPEVPIGKYARQFLANADAKQPGFAAGVNERVKTLELDVAHMVMRVRQGEVDAAIGYRTDGVGDGIIAIAIPPELDVIADYPVAVVAASKDPDLAEAYVAYLFGPGARHLDERGFSRGRPE